MERISSSFATRKTKKQKNSRDFFSEDTVVLHLKVSALLKESKEKLEWIKEKSLKWFRNDFFTYKQGIRPFSHMGGNHFS